MVFQLDGIGVFFFFLSSNYLLTYFWYFWKTYEIFWLLYRPIRNTDWTFWHVIIDSKVRPIPIISLLANYTINVNNIFNRCLMSSYLLLSLKFFHYVISMVLEKFHLHCVRMNFFCHQRFFEETLEHSITLYKYFYIA